MYGVLQDCAESTVCWVEECVAAHAYIILVKVIHKTTRYRFFQCHTRPWPYPRILYLSQWALEHALRKARLVTSLYMMIQTKTSGRTSPRVPLSTLQDKAQVSNFPDVFLGTVQPEAQATHSTHTTTASQITSLTIRCDLHYPKSSTRLFKIRATAA